MITIELSKKELQTLFVCLGYGMKLVTGELRNNKKLTSEQKKALRDQYDKFEKLRGVIGSPWKAR